MSLGLGILLSVILLITVWQVDKRGAWRKFGKVMLWLVAAIVIAGAGIGGYSWWDDRSSRIATEQAATAERQRVRSGELQEYWGVSLGMTMEEVRYLKGEPTEKMPRDNQNDEETWVWDDATKESAYMIWWDPQGKVTGVLCARTARGFTGECERVAGIGVNSRESDLRSILGEPIRPPTITKHGVKEFRYGSESTGWRFSLEQAWVTAILLYTPRDNTPKKE